MPKLVKPVRTFDCADTWQRVPFRCANGIETITDCNWRVAADALYYALGTSPLC
jgi:hypothetical protein